MKIAVITGASSGLGWEFSKAIAEKYRNLDEIWIIARRTDKLSQLSETYKASHIKPLSMDLTDPDSFEKLSGLLSQCNADIKILINNAGFCDCGRFDEMKGKSIQTMIDLNIRALTMMNKICFPYMNRGSFAVLTCSVSSFVPLMGQAVYSASKAYVRYLGQALHAEMKTKGINVLTLCPGNMNTEMNVQGDKEKSKAGSLPYLNVPVLVKKTLKKAEKGKGFYTPGFFYKGYRVLSKILPNYLLMHMTGGVFK